MNPNDQNQPSEPPVQAPQSPEPPAAPVAPQQPPVNYPSQGSDPGKGISIAGFVVSLVSVVTNFFLFGIPAVVGLVLSIVGRVQSKRGGSPNGLALAGIIISAISGVLTIAFWVFALVLGSSALSQYNEKCQQLGEGQHAVKIGDKYATLTCTADGKYSDLE